MSSFRVFPCSPRSIRKLNSWPARGLLAVPLDHRQKLGHDVHGAGGGAHVHFQRLDVLLLEPLGVLVLPLRLGVLPRGDEFLQSLGQLTAAFVNAHGDLPSISETRVT